MKIEMRRIADLKLYENNARTHSEEQLATLMESIKNYGFLDPIEISADNTVISGHARLEAARRLAIEDVPTLTHSHLSKNARKGYILAANKIAQKAGWDNDLLRDELGDLQDDGFDLLLTGFDQEELDDLLNFIPDTEGLEDENECGELPKTPKTVRGDVWLLGDHRLMCGDSTVVDEIDVLLMNSKIEMVFTDPPYGIDEKTDRTSRKKSQLAKSGLYAKIKNDKSTQVAIDSYNLCESMKIPLMIFWGANHYCHALPESPNWLVWDKREEDKERDTNSDCELAWVKSKAKSVRIFRHKWKGMIKASEHNEARCHPTQKPVALAEWCFNEYGKNAKTILDLFGGSGSTLIACEKNGRKCYTMELDEKYCDVIVERWQKFTGRHATLESTGETFNDKTEN